MKYDLESMTLSSLNYKYQSVKIQLSFLKDKVSFNFWNVTLLVLTREIII